MKKLITLLGLCSFALFVNAQEMKNYDEITKKNIVEKTNLDTVAWIYEGNLNLGLNQGILHNWAAGGELASITTNGQFNGILSRYYKRHLWTNNLDAAYGLFYAYSNHFIPRKTDDRIDFTSKYGYKLADSGNLFFSILFNAKTQFTKAYAYDVPNWDTFSTSKFFSPFYATLAPGLEYRKGSEISIFFSPLASRFTYVDPYYTTRFPEGAFGVSNGESTRFELGAYLTARYKKDFSETVSFKSRLDLYSNYLAKDKLDDNGVVVKTDKPTNIDIMWDNFLAFKFYKYFSLNIGLIAMYDNDVPYYKTIEEASGAIVNKDEPFQGLGWWQIKQSLTIGFHYKF